MEGEMNKMEISPAQPTLAYEFSSLITSLVENFLCLWSVYKSFKDGMFTDARFMICTGIECILDVSMSVILFLQLFAPHLLCSNVKRANKLNVVLTMYNLLRSMKKFGPLFGSRLIPYIRRISKDENEENIVNIIENVHIDYHLTPIICLFGIAAYYLFNLRNKPSSMRTLLLLMPSFALIGSCSFIGINEFANDISQKLDSKYNFSFISECICILTSLIVGDAYLAFGMFVEEKEHCYLQYTVFIYCIYKMIVNYVAYHRAKVLLDNQSNDEYNFIDGENGNYPLFGENDLVDNEGENLDDTLEMPDNQYK